MRYVAILLSLALVVLPSTLRAHPTERDVYIDTPLAEVAGTLLVPHVHDSVPCVVIIGGTMSHDRDGRLLGHNAPPRDALARLAEALAGGGYASLRYDQVGHGKSKPKQGWTGSYTDGAQVAAAVIKYARRDVRFDKVIVIGESAGAYLACLAAKEGTQADAYVFLGGLCGPSGELYEYNFGRLVEYAESSPENLHWAVEKHRYELALGRHWREMLKAAESGDDAFDVDDDGFALHVGGLNRRRDELAMPPDEMFRHIHAPALALAGEFDLNVPAEHAARAAEIMREAGNEKATSALINNADHSFQQSADSDDQRIRERFDFTSFRRPYQAKAYWAILNWLYETVPTSADEHPEEVEMAASRATRDDAHDHSHDHAHDHDHAHADSDDDHAHADIQAASGNVSPARAHDGVETDAVTDTTPERTYLAPGIEIVDDITDSKRTAGVDTLEGRIGPLILGEGSQAHFIDMPAGMYVAEHPHSSESLIYTVRGRWVLCSGGRRHLMKPGTLFRFGPNVPTGYEVPFSESAFILIFKGDRLSKSEAEFITYLQGMAERLEHEHQEGTPFLLRELPPDHSARVFAAKVNPDWERKISMPKGQLPNTDQPPKPATSRTE